MGNGDPIERLLGAGDMRAKRMPMPPGYGLVGEAVKAEPGVGGWTTTGLGGSGNAAYVLREESSISSECVRPSWMQYRPAVRRWTEYRVFRVSREACAWAVMGGEGDGRCRIRILESGE